MITIPIYYIKEPIFDAVAIDDRLAAKTLIDQGCNLKWQEDDEGHESCPLFYAAELGRLEILKLMLESKTRFSKELLTQALIEGCLNGHLSVVDLFVKKGVKISISSVAYSFTPLTAAVRYNHLEIVKYLVEAGAKVEQNDPSGIYPLSMAAIFGYQEIFDYLEPLTLSVSKRKEAKKEILAKLAECNS
jgi:ankyrin repeat protein